MDELNSYGQPLKPKRKINHNVRSNKALQKQNANIDWNYNNAMTNKERSDHNSIGCIVWLICLSIGALITFARYGTIK